MKEKKVTIIDIRLELTDLRSSLVLTDTILDEMNFLNDDTYDTIEIMEGIRVANKLAMKKIEDLCSLLEDKEINTKGEIK